jgi:hypothetical protein
VRWLAFVLVGCVSEPASIESAPEVVAGDVVEPGMRLSVVAADGSERSVASDKQEVFIALSGKLTAADAVGIDYVFRVIDLAGDEVSLDDALCRRFFVDEEGRIAGGVGACAHAVVTGRIELQPFADVSADERGFMRYLVQIAPAAASLERSSLKATFAVAALPSS